MSKLELLDNGHAMLTCNTEDLTDLKGLIDRMQGAFCEMGLDNFTLRSVASDLLGPLVSTSFFEMDLVFPDRTHMITQWQGGGGEPVRMGCGLCCKLGCSMVMPSPRDPSGFASISLFSFFNPLVSIESLHFEMSTTQRRHGRPRRDPRWYYPADLDLEIGVDLGGVRASLLPDVCPPGVN